jgi:PIN domain nuclease of toxin-antitoxin system
MIVLDTHIWIWWVHGDPKLSQNAIAAIQSIAKIFDKAAKDRN